MAATPDEAVLRISDIVSGFAEEAQQRAMEELDATADRIIDYIRGHAPRGESGEHLADSFVKTEQGSGLSRVIYISSSSKGRLVHLIELGFRHRSGKHVAARPFMRPAYEAFAPAMLEEIKKIIGGGT